MRYFSLFSGVEAATLAWAPLGWEPACLCEVDPFPSAVLAHRLPSVPNLGDVTKVDWKEAARAFGRPDVVVGGSPCQSFSIAGKRDGLAGASGLMWEYVRAVRELMPRWVVWENVPGALSSSHGEDFGCLLRALDGLGYGLAWRVLDAQFFGVAQRRRRLFLVGCLGDPERACQVLFEPEGLRWDPPSSREKRQELAARAGGGPAGAGVYGIAGNVEGRSPANGGNGIGFCDPGENGFYTLTATDRPGIARPAAPSGGDGRCEATRSACGGGCPGGGKGPLIQEEVSGTLATGNDQTVFCLAGDHAKAACDEDMCGTLSAHDAKGGPMAAVREASAVCQYGEVAGALAARADSSPCADRGPSIVADGPCVRRLTPRECERLQGMPDDWTRVPYRGRSAEECPDGPRYKAIGNSMAVPVMRWIGERIAMVEKEMGGD